MELGIELPVCRVIVNQSHAFATGGSFTNGLPFSLSMGCGTWGKNSIDDNLNHKHFINTQLVELIQYRQARKWYVSIAVVGIFAFILSLMIYFMAGGKDVTEGWKEILLLMLGGFVGSFAKVIDFWFNNQENDNKLLEHADD